MTQTPPAPTAAAEHLETCQPERSVAVNVLIQSARLAYRYVAYLSMSQDRRII